MNKPGNSTCSCCGKPLTDPVSLDLGMGPVCRIAVKSAEAANPTGSLFAARASYDYSIEGGVVCIVDLDKGMSVTNDADSVISDLLDDGVDLDKNMVIYRDSMGVWDQLKVVAGCFAGFKSINERDKNAAKAKVLAASRK